MAHFLAHAAQCPARGHGGVSVYDAVCTYRAHRRTPAPSGWHADSTSATRVTQSAGAWLTTARRLSLYAYSRYPQPQRCALSVELGTWRPAGPGEPEISHCFCEARDKRVVCRWQDAGLQPESVVRAGCHHRFLGALRPPRCPDLWQEVDSACTRKDHHRMRLHVCVMKPHAGQAFDTVWVSTFGHELGAFLHPAHLVEPATHRCR
jgi:hypothetical protein